MGPMAPTAAHGFTIDCVVQSDVSWVLQMTESPYSKGIFRNLNKIVRSLEGFHKGWANDQAPFIRPLNFPSAMVARANFRREHSALWNGSFIASPSSTI
jgi:hypothetical protein